VGRLKHLKVGIESRNSRVIRTLSFYLVDIMKIDICPHILPPRYRQALEKRLSEKAFQVFKERSGTFTALTDLGNRLTI
jgi:hypothetical protein